MAFNASEQSQPNMLLWPQKTASAAALSAAQGRHMSFAGLQGTLEDPCFVLVPQHRLQAVQLRHTVQRQRGLFKVEA